MAPSFLLRDLFVEVDEKTWPRTSVPPQLRGASGDYPIDMGRAFHMLGTLTMPNILSPASPALFWGWLRYYLAPASSPDLRITMDFSDLDPHQKGILSDDFGVAIATQWLSDKLGPFTHIVDGRRFANQFSRLLRRQHKSKAKVGMSKAPDFVMRDSSGKWHVLECKGTQSSRDYQRSALKTAVVQKHALQLAGSIRGEQLASSLYIANEKDTLSSCLKIIDPEDEDPLLRLTGLHADEMVRSANRLAVAQALGSIGLNEMAVELSLPPNVDPESELLRPSEFMRLRTSREERTARATEQVRERVLNKFSHNRRPYEGRVLELELPQTGTSFRFRKVRIRQGVTHDLIEAVAADDSLGDETLDARVAPYTGSATIKVESDGRSTSLTYGDVLYSELTWS